MNLRKSQFKQRYILFVIAGLILLNIGSVNVFGQQTVADQQTVNSPILDAENYRIGPGDIIDVLVSKNEVLSRSNIRVNNQGMIQLPMLDSDVTAVCQTEKELAMQISEKYKKYLLNPSVLVSVKEFNSTPVTVIGAVNSPTRFALQGPTRLLEAITRSNGPSAKAGASVQVIRNSNMGYCEQKVMASGSNEQLVSYSLEETLKGEDQANPYVQAGDVVRVVDAEVEKVGQVFIVGNVKSAKAIDLKDPLTLTQAIAMSGGTLDGANTEKVKISRQIPGSLDKTAMIVNLKEINKQNKGDVLLQANDIVEVPGASGGKKFITDIFLKTAPTVIRRATIGF